MDRRRVLSRVVRLAVLVVVALTIAGHSAAQDRELNDSPDFRVRVQAALRLGRAGGASARADLERGLRDAHPAVRVACAVGLGNIGDTSSIAPLQAAMKGETYATVKNAMKETIDKLRNRSGGSGGGGGDSSVSVDKAKYVVQLGAMRNVSGVRSSDLDAVMRQAARTRASSIKGALILENADPGVLKKASARRIPVLLIDGNLTRLTQTKSKDGSFILSAKVDMSIRRVPQQTLQGTVSGNASVSHEGPSAQGLAELQNRVVGGAVESALNTMSQEISAFAK